MGLLLSGGGSSGDGGGASGGGNFESELGSAVVPVPAACLSLNRGRPR